MPTTNDIGTAGGRDYATIAAWEAATDNSLTSSGGFYGELHHDAAGNNPDFTWDSSTAGVTIDGASNINASRYRKLFVAAGDKYDPVTGSGFWIKRQTNSGTSANRRAFTINENYFRMVDVTVVDDESSASTSGATQLIALSEVGTRRSIRLDSCYFRLGGLYADGTAGTASGSVVRVYGGHDHKIHNCIVVGGQNVGTKRGAHYGIRIDSVSNPANVPEIVGCTVFGITGWNASSPSACRGISGAGSQQQRVHNTIVMRDPVLTTGNDYATDLSGLISFNGETSFVRGVSTSDYTGQQGFGSELYNSWNVAPSETFLSAINHDFRLISTAPAQDIDNWELYDDAGITKDFYGNTRSTSNADLGAFGGSAQLAAEAPPTVVVETIGSGGDYSTIAAWEAATDLNLIDRNEVRIGEVTGALDASTSLATFDGAITDPVRYRWLRPSATNHWNQFSLTGATLSTTGSAAEAYPVVAIAERYFRLSGPMKLTLTGASTNGTAGTSGVVEVRPGSTGSIIEKLFVTAATSQAAMSFATGIIVHDSSTNVTIRNCVIWGNDSVDNKSIYGGIRVRGAGSSVNIYNCTVYGTGTLSAAGDQKGIWVDSSTGCVVRNCIAIGSDEDDFNLPAGTVRTNNVSGDSTASGTDSVTGKTGGETFADAASDNFYLKAGNTFASGLGYSLFSDGVIDDAVGNGRYTPFDIGALDGSRPYPQFPHPSRRTRVCTCFEIIRKDGTRLTLTDNSTPLEFMGRTWTPMTLDASARRRELGNKAADMEVRGAISSDQITQADLRAGRYQGAKIAEYMVDWRYPHLKPLLVTRYAIESTKFTGEHFEANVKGLAFILQNKVGDVYGRTCRYVLGDDKCKAVYTTQSNKTVESPIGDARREFYLADGAITDTDGVFALGKLTWLTGNNKGLVTEVYSNDGDLAVNSAPGANDIDNSSYWSLSDVTRSQVTNGFSSGVHSFLVARTSSTAKYGYMRTISSGSPGAWSTYAPSGTRVCLSAYVKRPSSTPASYFSLGLEDDSIATSFAGDDPVEPTHAAGFRWNGSAWVQVGTSELYDAGISVEITNVTGNTDWWRLSMGYTSNGTETGYARIRLGVGVGADHPETNLDLEVSQCQIETGTLTPTTWTTAVKHKITLALPTPLEIQAGDTFDLEPGCNKLRSTCKDTFSNVENFGGFPYIPGTDKMFDTPTQ